MITFRRTKQLGKKNARLTSKRYRHLPSYMVRENEQGDITEIRICPSSYYTKETLDFSLGYNFITFEQRFNGNLEFVMPQVSFFDANNIFELHQKFLQDIEQINCGTHEMVGQLIDSLENAGFVRAEYIYAGIRCNTIHEGLERYILIDENDNCTAHIWVKNEKELFEIVDEKEINYSKYFIKY